jgi:hypothetical protein
MRRKTPNRCALGGTDGLMPTLESPPRAPEVRSGSGGTHLYFQHPDGRVPSRANIRPGIDVKADGGYVVAPPSRHVSGDRYHFTRDNGFVLPELHSALRDLILPTEARAHAASSEQPPKVTLDNLRVSDERVALADVLKMSPRYAALLTSSRRTSNGFGIRTSRLAR